jgi:hypothetical protein
LTLLTMTRREIALRRSLDPLGDVVPVPIPGFAVVRREDFRFRIQSLLPRSRSMVIETNSSRQLTHPRISRSIDRSNPDNNRLKSRTNSEDELRLPSNQRPLELTVITIREMATIRAKPRLFCCLLCCLDPLQRRTRPARAVGCF